MSKRAMKRGLLVLLILLGGPLFAMHFIYPWVETAAFYHSVLGIDVSHHQGAIDWDRLKARGVDFAYIKASEGENFNDPRFSRNWYASEQAGHLHDARIPRRLPGWKISKGKILGSKPDAAPTLLKKQWIFWQYHNRGRRPGIDGPVDLNAFRGTIAELQAL